MQTFYFYDYETFGVSPKTSRIAQFAGIRTDLDLNIVEEEMFYCKPTRDSLPDPISCNITGISPQFCQNNGVIEREFIERINKQFSQKGTCVVGYNNIRFDDEFTRYTLYRNFFDPYAWSWQGGNSRWDLLDVVRMCYALKPDTMNWVFEDKKPIFKLDRLAPKNNIEFKAHDALGDVRATIALAKIIKTKQPKLFDYALSLRDKKVVNKNITLFEPMLHTSGMYSAKLGCTRRCVALGYSHFGNVILFNLDQNPNILLELDTDELKTLMFTKSKNLPKNIERLQIKELHPNKSPMFVSNINKLSAETISHLSIDMEKTNQHLDFILKNRVAIKLQAEQLFAKIEFDKINDIDQGLYAGFLSNNDRKLANIISITNKQDLININPSFEDTELNKLFINFKGRNYPELLNDKEKEYWFETVQERIQAGNNDYQSIEDFELSLIKLKQEFPEKIKLWNKLEQYVQTLI